MEASATIKGNASSATLSASKQALLEARLRGALKGTGKKPAISPRTDAGPAPLSFTQQQLWFIDQLEPASPAYIICSGFRLEGALNIPALEEALNDIVQRHEILRTTFPPIGGEPKQVILPAQRVALKITDLESLPPEQREGAVQNILTEEAGGTFNLAEGPLVRFRLARLSEREHILVTTMHHIVSDGWSMAVFYRELAWFYDLRSENKQDAITASPALPNLPIQFADFAVWQQQQFQTGAMATDLEYWKKKLAGIPESLALPVDKTGTSSRSEAKCVSFHFSPELQKKLLEFCQARQATPFMVILAALEILLYRWTGQSDIVLGTVQAGRTRRETEPLIGCFMNFLPLRLEVRNELSGSDFLDRVKANFLEATSHQESPFAKIVEAVNPSRKLNQNPIYNVAFLAQTWPQTEWNAVQGDASKTAQRDASPYQSDVLRGREILVDAVAPLLDLRWLAEELDSRWRITCEYDTALFTAETAQELVESFRLVLDQLLAQPQSNLAAFALTQGLLAQAERAAAVKTKELLAIAGTFTAEPLEEPLRYWTEELSLPLQVEFAPYNQVFQQMLDPKSLLCGNRRGLNVLLLRLEDWTKADSGRNGEDPERNARELVTSLKEATARTSVPWLLCVCPGKKVKDVEEKLLRELKTLPGVHVLTSEELFASYPVANYADADAERLGHVPYTPLFYTALATMIVRKFHALKRPPRKVIALDCDQTLWSGICGEDGCVNLDAPRVALQELMRRLYDSGMLICLCSKNNEEDVWTVFDQNAQMPLRREHLAAWRLNWLPKSENLRSLASELRLGLDSFIFIDDNPVECAEVEAACPEVLTLRLPEVETDIPKFLQHVWALDIVQVTAEDRNRNLLYQQNRAREQLQSQSLSFADFLAGLNLKIVIEKAQPEQMARVAQLTQRTNQFNSTTRRRSEAELGQVLGTHELLAVSVSDRFGDYGLVGVLIYSATAEALQVETSLLSCRALGKGVEHQMLAHLGREAQTRGLRRVDVEFVQSAKNKPAQQFLESVGAAFRRTSGGTSIYRFPAEIAAGIVFRPEQEEMPAPSEPAPKPTSSGFALPVQFQKCSWIAQNAQDAESVLAAINSKLKTSTRSARSYVGPRTASEEQLCRIWSELLRVERVGIKDDFFELGGTSLLAVRLFAEIQKVFNKNLPLVSLFKAPDVEQLARLLEQKKSKPASSSLVAIQPKGERPPLILVHGAGGGLLWGYANLAAKLGPDQPVYAIEPRQRAGAHPQTVEEMARRYVGELREFQPRGPYYLGGYCFGGYIAYEMARQLSEAGDAVALLALIDAAAPNGSYERIPWWRPSYAFAFLRNCFCWFENFRRWKGSEQRSFLRRKSIVALKRMLRKAKLISADPDLLEVEDFIDSSNFPEDELALWEAHLHAGGEYVPKKYSGKVTLLRTRIQPVFCSLDPQYGWGELAQGGVEVKLISGSHENIFLEPDLESLAEKLNNCLANAQAQKKHS